MKHKIFYHELECYERATEAQLQQLNKEQYFDLDQLPEGEIRKEFAEYIWYRGTQVTILTIKAERHHFNSLCSFLQKPVNRVGSLAEKEDNVWIRQLKAWMVQNGRQITRNKINMYGNPKIENSELVRYLTNLLVFTKEETETNELDKDIWRLDRLPVTVRTNPIRNVETVNFTKILQPDMRTEVKKAIYYHLKYEAIQTILRELTVMRKFSSFLRQKYPDIQSCEDIARTVIEEYLIHMKVGTRNGNGKRDDLLKLRNVLETVGKIYNFGQLENLFLNTDFPPARRGEFKTYSDSELKRLNAELVRLEEQLARAIIIHQMLGTRISDTLTLKRDCLYKTGGQDMITIFQQKTKKYVKPISRELAELIQKAIDYAEKHYGDSMYIFTDEKNRNKPLQYNTLHDKAVRLIYKQNLRDDKGEIFRFGMHMFRRYYGVKLTELHVDDWTIAKLLGHKNVKNVKYYRKMSNQTMADETRSVRQYMSEVIRKNLKGWGEEYEQIR